MFEGLAAVAAQTEEYAQRFRELGTPAERVTVTDTMKWDTVRLVDEVEGAAELRAAMGIDPVRPLVVAGSTGPGRRTSSSGVVRRGFSSCWFPGSPNGSTRWPGLVPGIVRRSERPNGFVGPGGGSSQEMGVVGEGGADLFLLDTMGELTKAYALADVAIVGRSFVPLGGSDPIESVALGKPTLIGPRHENFREVVSALESEGGLRVTDRPMEVVRELAGLGR